MKFHLHEFLIARQGKKTAWAIYLKDDDCLNYYVFHSAFATKKLAKEMKLPASFDGWKGAKIVKIQFSIDCTEKQV